jgi:hypothetical protein
VIKIILLCRSPIFIEKKCRSPIGVRLCSVHGRAPTLGGPRPLYGGYTWLEETAKEFIIQHGWPHNRKILSPVAFSDN